MVSERHWNNVIEIGAGINIGDVGKLNIVVP